MKKAAKRSSRMKWAKRIVFGLVALGATFGAGYLCAGAKEDPASPRRRLLVPEGYTVESVYVIATGWHVRARDAAGGWHIFVYSGDKGDCRILYHTAIAEKVPVEQAFDD